MQRNLTPSPDVSDLAARYVTWALEFERTCMESGRQASRYFFGEGLSLYTRWARTKLATQGRPTFVLANIEVAPELRGRGLFSLICGRLMSEESGLKSDALYVELVGEPRLAAWLTRNGFSKCPHSDDIAPSFYLLRTGSASSELVEDKLAELPSWTQPQTLR
ncbi:hypothetical protein [Acidovorax facilis]|jgi:hypothetical protein|uniref:hypothetical protein n=1 Tax=Acidovorax facilis TaxID=12917 RepID=UPI003D65A1F6